MHSNSTVSGKNSSRCLLLELPTGVIREMSKYLTLQEAIHLSVVDQKIAHLLVQIKAQEEKGFLLKLWESIVNTSLFLPTHIRRELIENSIGGVEKTCRSWEDLIQEEGAFALKVVKTFETLPGFYQVMERVKECFLTLAHPFSYTPVGYAQILERGMLVHHPVYHLKEERSFLSSSETRLNVLIHTLLVALLSIDPRGYNRATQQALSGKYEAAEKDRILLALCQIGVVKKDSPETVRSIMRKIERESNREEAFVSVVDLADSQKDTEMLRSLLSEIFQERLSGGIQNWMIHKLARLDLFKAIEQGITYGQPAHELVHLVEEFLGWASSEEVQKFTMNLLYRSAAIPDFMRKGEEFYTLLDQKIQRENDRQYIYEQLSQIMETLAKESDFLNDPIVISQMIKRFWPRGTSKDVAIELLIQKCRENLYPEEELLPSLIISPLILSLAQEITSPDKRMEVVLSLHPEDLINLITGGTPFGQEILHEMKEKRSLVEGKWEPLYALGVGEVFLQIAKGGAIAPVLQAYSPEIREKILFRLSAQAGRLIQERLITPLQAMKWVEEHTNKEIKAATVESLVATFLWMIQEGEVSFSSLVNFVQEEGSEVKEKAFAQIVEGLFIRIRESKKEEEALEVLDSFLKAGHSELFQRFIHKLFPNPPISLSLIISEAFYTTLDKGIQKEEEREGVERELYAQVELLKEHPIRQATVFFAVQMMRRFCREGAKKEERVARLLRASIEKIYENSGAGGEGKCLVHPLILSFLRDIKQVERKQEIAEVLQNEDLIATIGGEYLSFEEIFPSILERIDEGKKEDYLYALGVGKIFLQIIRRKSISKFLASYQGYITEGVKKRILVRLTTQSNALIRERVITPYQAIEWARNHASQGKRDRSLKSIIQAIPWMVQKGVISIEALTDFVEGIEEGSIREEAMNQIVDCLVKLKGKGVRQVKTFLHVASREMVQLFVSRAADSYAHAPHDFLKVVRLAKQENRVEWFPLFIEKLRDFKRDEDVVREIIEMLSVEDQASLVAFTPYWTSFLEERKMGKEEVLGYIRHIESDAERDQALLEIIKEHELWLREGLFSHEELCALLKEVTEGDLVFDYQIDLLPKEEFATEFAEEFFW